MIFIKYKCSKCNYETDIPYKMIKLIIDANKILSDCSLNKITFNCKNCEGKIQPINIKNTKKDNVEIFI